VTSRADAEYAIRAGDRQRAERFLTSIRRGELGALVGGGRDHREPTRAFDGSQEHAPAPEHHHDDQAAACATYPPRYRCRATTATPASANGAP